MVSREFDAFEPKLKSEIRWCNYNPEFELAEEVGFVTETTTTSSLIHAH